MSEKMKVILNSGKQTMCQWTAPRCPTIKGKELEWCKNCPANGKRKLLTREEGIKAWKKAGVEVMR